MDDLHRTLDDISSVRRSQRSCGYGSTTLTGTRRSRDFGISGAGIMDTRSATHISAYLTIWISTAAVSAALIGAHMHIRTRRIHSSLAGEMIRMAVEQFLPSGRRWGAYSLRTNSSGAYTFTKLPSGSYDVLLRAPLLTSALTPRMTINSPKEIQERKLNKRVVTSAILQRLSCARDLLV
jgi:hypothetical protein